MLGLSESLRAELRGAGVDLSVVLPGLVRTELAAGTLQGSKVLAPDDVAQAIVGVIERPRFDVYMPRAYRGLPVVAALLPRPAREAFLRAVGVGRNTAGTTADERSAYENRAAGE